VNYLFYLALLLAGLAIRIALHFVDKGRIEEAARSKGWREVVIHWAPLAPGFFFEPRERHYFVTYRDQDGRSGQVYCKTSLLTGIFWRN